ncbi:hypothetical protein BDA99DRAFT_183751 [Phascolomyces articulosus]|uniref:Uncharacterized protein n=1 Tax=Phascolomyces articulosus TaxID=60185 RepID=A0AAD5PA27_9FUNG|nr:hypothetical protein BDA99DRAFT_183751 [Phascolomyces articulosus]
MTQLQDAAASDHPSPLDMEQAKDKFFHEQVIDLTKWALSETDALHNKILKAGLSSQLAMAYGNIGQWGEAFDTVNTIFEITPHLPEGYLCESQLYLMQGYIPRAVDSINKGLEQIPNDDATLQHQAMLLSSYQHQQQEQQFDKKQYYDSIIENTTWTLDADSPSMTPDITMRLYKLRAVTYGKIYQFTKAFKDADTLSDLFSDIPDVFLCYGQLYWIQGFKRRALEKIDEGLIQFPDDPRLKREAAVLLQQLRRVDIFATAPLEITDRIIAYLDPIKHVLSPSPSLLSVSKTWRSRILNCVSLWSTVNTFDFYVDDEESVLRAIDQFCYVLPLLPVGMFGI